MNDIQIFNYSGNEVRAIQKDGEPWFVLKDVCAVLDLGSAHKVADRLDEDERNQIPLTDSLGRAQTTTIINESGLYNVILRSDKPEAKPFRKWVTTEILPSIRKHGAYMTENTLENMIASPEFGIKLLTALQEEREQRVKLEAKVESDAPKVLFADAVNASHTTILVGELAKLLKQNGKDIGQNRLFAYLRDNGYLIKRSGRDYNMPTQRSMERGWFTIKERTVQEPNGSISVKKTPLVTGKGQQYFINLFLGQ